MAAGSADAQYAIEIAAQMTGADHTISDLDTLTAEMTGAGKSAEHFQQAISQVSRNLDEARRVAETANSALAEGKTEYVLLERAAEQTAKAAERAAKKNAGVVPD